MMGLACLSPLLVISVWEGKTVGDVSRNDEEWRAVVALSFDVGCFFFFFCFGTRTGSRE